MPRKRKTGPMRVVMEPMPDAMAAWFANAYAGIGLPWQVLCDGYEREVRAWWREWGAEHPDAMPPADTPKGFGLLRGGASIFDAQKRDGRTAQSAERKTDAEIDEIQTEEKDTK